MTGMRNALAFLCALYLSVCVSACAHAGDAALAALFHTAGVDGTIVIESLDGRQRFVHDDVRAARPYAAASTFKILNTLIALEEGAVSDADSPIPWDGTRYESADWNRDQTLESAFRVSCVWCYQLLARRVGAAKYPAYIARAGYGRLREPFSETGFWLDGSLTISADEQVAFLRRVVARSLPFKPGGYETLKRIMLVEATPLFRLYAKSGWATRVAPPVGWYVGYVETRGATWLFALNLATRDAGDLPLRPQLVRQALRAKGLLPAP